MFRRWLAAKRTLLQLSEDTLLEDCRRLLELTRARDAQPAALDDGHLQQLQRTEAVVTSLLTAGLVARNERRHRPHRPWPSNYRPAPTCRIEDDLERLRALHPDAFAVWRGLFDNARRCYYEQPEGSCSHKDHWFARLFGAYVDVYAFGRLLDVGCGPHGLPAYLAAYEPTVVSGLDPLEPVGPVPFEYVRGFNEFLPWPDGSFHTVVSGTSLDHVLSLERSLQEVRRVLVRDGRYLVWLASIPGAPPYAPEQADPKPIDAYHLFHFDRVWIEPLLERYFRVVDVSTIPQPGFDHVFYCLVPR